MDNYICLNCKFKFKTSQNPKTCPYCDKRTIEKEQGAGDIVDEVSELLKE
jgi:DNA-directed RNA polymerase subunit RPC12/RpoP